MNAQYPESPDIPDYWTFVDAAKIRLNEQYGQEAVQASHLAMSLNRASETIKQVSELLVHRPRKLTWSGFRILFVLWNLGEVEQARLTTMINASKATVSNLVAGLISQGYVKRRSSETDRRTFLLQLTPEGEQAVEELYLEQNALFVQWSSVLDEEERQTLVRLVDKLMQRRTPLA